MDINCGNSSYEDNRTAEVKFRDASIVMGILLSGMGVWVIIYALWEHLGRPIPVSYLVQAVDLLGIIMCATAWHFTSTFSLRELELLPDNPKKTIIQTLIICGISFGILAAIKYFGQLYDPTLFQTERGFFDIRRFNSYQIFYLVTAFIQEFTARSIMQTGLRRVCATSHKTIYAIVHASIIFAVFHIEYGFWFMIGAAFLGGILGVIYEKQKTIFGVWFIHWFLGVAAFLFGIINQ
ncbi:CPBP family intramembrane glutamic endopeptidase [Pseudobutyrivibrio xylanivorans]|uniref:Predicted membrane protein n=1 Tax=Pseudobutyrivibrio xylanivorans DSM 14809 TaxID=1123012 RepID=A0A1M5ZYW2_PSEXY|nr:CPBP family intramembrane glutamic endopeptidase [Pseudobutyrivibrio xylanivorans]SHI29467.1 Predicted membrane protein [Pseudobutyrivibrio xylanivorans DSM 14809]